MSLPHAILGILHNQPMTGYDLKTQFFDRSITHFWSADQAQIYRTLDKLADKGWAESEIEVQEGRPNRKVYTITDAGTRELRRWLATDQGLQTLREPFVVQLFFAHLLHNEKAIVLLENQLALHRERLATYEQIPLPSFDELKTDRERTFQRFTLDIGLEIEKTYIRWLEDTIERVKQLPPK